ncbi:MAG: terpene cyclase/mutase family protein [Planctomycetes bacterium]|nr:terpene cyclase/mutase family protein [Planctomycetota bacterium]
MSRISEARGAGRRGFPRGRGALLAAVLFLGAVFLASIAGSLGGMEQIETAGGAAEGGEAAPAPGGSAQPVGSGQPPSAEGGTPAGERTRAPGASIDYRAIYEETPVTRAVDRGIEYLRGAQASDGSWLSPGYGKNPGIVSLAVLAFLARGEEPGRGEHGEAIEKAVLWILQSQQESGLIVGPSSRTSNWPMYGHGIAALLLGQVVGMIPERRPGFENLARAHRDAVDLILKSQNVWKAPSYFGGWRYRPGSTDSDLSVSGWQLLALRAAEEAGLAIPRRNIEQAVRFVVRCARPGGEFVYHPGEDQTSIALTGTGILSLQLCGEHDSREARRGGDWLLEHPLRWRGRWFYYSAYYSAQAMFQLGGRHWDTWKPLSESLLLEHQAEDGHWPFPPGAELEVEAGPVYSTALAILSLAVEFRYLPIYQR